MNFDFIRRATIGKALFVAAVAFFAAFFVYGDETPTTATAQATPPYGITFPAKVVRVVDGDTLEVEVTRVVRIRMLDCWAPETRTRDIEEKLRGFAAKTHLEEMAQNQQVKVFIPVKPGQKVGDSFSFGRALGQVWLNGETTSLSEKMVTAGHATRTRDGR